jgi:hypothetical protein
LIFISAFIGEDKFNKNTFGVIVSRIGWVFVMLGIFPMVGVVDNIITSSIHLAGFVLLVLGLFLKNPPKEKKQ